MKIVLKPGEKLEIALADDSGEDIDGSIIVDFQFNELKITTDWPDSDGRVGTIYSERFRSFHDDDLFLLRRF